MNVFEKNIRNYWNYYLELENEFIETKRYVEFVKDNYSAFSIEFLKLYQAICSEIDVIGKYIASLINPSFSRVDNKSINQWWIEIQDYSNFYLNIKNINNPSVKPINICDARIHNYIIDESFQPWAKYKLERYLDRNGKNRIRLLDGSQNPKWWTLYNKVKHHRTESDKNGKTNFKEANLKNVCESISALYILELLVLELSINSKIQYENFYNATKLFYKPSWVTSKEIDELFNHQ